MITVWRYSICLWKNTQIEGEGGRMVAIQTVKGFSWMLKSINLMWSRSVSWHEKFENPWMQHPQMIQKQKQQQHKTILPTAFRESSILSSILSSCTRLNFGQWKRQAHVEWNTKREATKHEEKQNKMKQTKEKKTFDKFVGCAEERINSV